MLSQRVVEFSQLRVSAQELTQHREDHVMASFELWSEITTDATGANGVRHDARSGWDSTTAPPGWVIDDRSVRVEWHGQNGSENDYQMAFDDQTPIRPGSPLTFPRTIKVQTHARSPKGFSSGRGWSKIRVVGDFIQL